MDQLAVVQSLGLADQVADPMPDPEQRRDPLGAGQRPTTTASSSLRFDDDLELSHPLPPVLSG